MTEDLLQLTDPASLLSAVFDAQREAEQHLDASMTLEHADAYAPSGYSASGRAEFAAAAASLRRGAALLDKLAGIGDGQAVNYPAEPCSWHGAADRRTCPGCARGDGPSARVLGGFG